MEVQKNLTRKSYRLESARDRTHQLTTTAVKLLGYASKVHWQPMLDGVGLKIDLSTVPFGELKNHYAWTFKLEHIA